jgi:predicted RNA-binding Zn-ribbon protein involved in translation (DUF1610 family)
MSEKMKEVMIRKEEKMNIEQKDGYTIYKCPHCGNELVRLDKDKEFSMMSSCKHFQWEEISITYYALPLQEYQPKYVKQLKKNAIITIFNGISVYLLVPKP